MKRIIPLLIGSVSALAGTLLIVYISFFSTVVTDSFFQKTNREYNVAGSLKMSDADLDRVTSSMLSYVKGKQDTLQVTVTVSGVETEFFNTKELTHIADVRVLIHNIQLLAIICAVIFLFGAIYLFCTKQSVYLAKGYFVGLSVIAFAILATGITAIVNVKLIIRGFHRLVFHNDLWILNPALDRVVWLFPDNLYIKALICAGGCLIILLALTAALAIWAIKKSKKH